MKNKTKEKSSDKLTTDSKRQKIQFHQKQVCKGKTVLEYKSISVSCHSSPTSTIKLPLDHKKGKSDNKMNCPKETFHFKWYLLRSKCFFFAISFHLCKHLSSTNTDHFSCSTLSGWYSKEKCSCIHRKALREDEAAKGHSI